MEVITTESYSIENDDSQNERLVEEEYFDNIMTTQSKKENSITIMTAQRKIRRVLIFKMLA